jgi:hypothetical protein
MVKPNSSAFCVATVLVVGLMGGCGGGGDDAKVPDPASHDGKVEEPQMPVRNAAVLAGIRQLQPVPEALQEDMPGLNATIQLLLHNPAWGKKAMAGDLSKEFALVEEYRGMLDLVIAFREGLDLAKPHARLTKALYSASTPDAKRKALAAALELVPTKIDAINDRLSRGETFATFGADDTLSQFDQLPAQQRIIGIAVFDGTDRIAYLKKGEDWFGTNERKFTKVTMDYIKRLGLDAKVEIFAVSYSAA